MRRSLFASTVFLIALGAGWSQTNEPSQTKGAVIAADGSVQPEPAPASAEPPEDPSADEVSQPPDSGPVPAGAGLSESRSSLQLGIHASQGMENNPSGLFGYSSQYSPITNVLASVSLHEARHRSDTTVAYSGGASLYDGYGNAKLYAQQIEQLTAGQSFQWQKVRVSFRDIFQYLSEGTYGSSSLSVTAAPINSVGSGSGPTVTNFPTPLITVGQDSYLMNGTGGDLSYLLDSRSSVFVAGEYSFINYFGTGESELNSRQVSTSAGYSYQLTRKESIGAFWGYQTFQYPSGGLGSVTSNSAQFTYRRILTGRMDLDLNGGPDFTVVRGGGVPQTRQIGVTASAQLSYKWERSGIHIGYDHQIASGSGLFAGVTEDVGLVSFEHALGRHWQSSLSGGYIHGTQLGLTVPGQAFGSFAFEFAGATVQRRLGRRLSMFANYQFDGENFTDCTVASGCNPVIRRNIVMVGLDLHFRPILLE